MSRRIRERARREYANFCAVAHTPFDLTLTFCDVRPLSERDIKSAEQSQTVRAPVVARIALPFGVVPGLIAALQEQLRAVQEAQAGAGGAELAEGPAPLSRAWRVRRRPKSAGAGTVAAWTAAKSRRSSIASTRSIPTPTTELHFTQRVRAARRHDPVRAVHRRARESGDAGALRALSGRRGAGAGRRPKSSSRRFSRPGSSA